MILDKNGLVLSSNQTRHINIIYFFSTDRVALNEMNIEYYPTENMLDLFFINLYKEDSLGGFVTLYYIYKRHILIPIPTVHCIIRVYW